MADHSSHRRSSRSALDATADGDMPASTTESELGELMKTLGHGDYQELDAAGAARTSQVGDRGSGVVVPPVAEPPEASALAAAVPAMLHIVWGFWLCTLLYHTDATGSSRRVRFMASPTNPRATLLPIWLLLIFPRSVTMTKQVELELAGPPNGTMPHAIPDAKQMYAGGVTGAEAGFIPANDTECRSAIWRKGYAAPTLHQRTVMKEWFDSHSVLMLGDSTMHQLAVRLQKLGLRVDVLSKRKRTTSCPPAANICMRRLLPCEISDNTVGEGMHKHWAEYNNRTKPWDVVVWNMMGLHYLHLQPPTLLQKALEEARPSNITVIRERYARCAQTLNRQHPGAKIALRLTNHVCEGQFYGRYADARDTWLSRPWDPASFTAMTRRGSTTLNVLEAEIAGNYLHLLQESFTEDLCVCTPFGDGRHYRWTEDIILWSLYTKLTQS